jgi:hypothetical protein
LIVIVGQFVHHLHLIDALNVLWLHKIMIIVCFDDDVVDDDDDDDDDVDDV